MSIVNGYCTAQDVRNQFADTGTALSTSLIERAVNAASRAIDRHCQRRFWLDTAVATRTYMVPSAGSAYVDDIGTRTGLVVKIGTDGSTFPTTLAAGIDFILEPRNADKYDTDTFGAYAFWQIRPLAGGRGLYLSTDMPTLSVTAQFGWSAVPDDVTEACIIKAASLFKRKDATFGVAGFSEFGAVRITRSDPDVLDLLAEFKIPVA